MAESSCVSVDSDDAVCCTVCTERFNDEDRQPKVLQCGHTYCVACLKGWQRSKKREIISCPECSREQKLDKKGVDGLPTNFSILRAARSTNKESKSDKNLGNSQLRGAHGSAGTCSSQHELQHLLSTLKALAADVHKSGKVFDETINAIRGERHDVTVRQEETVKSIATEYNEIVKTAAKRKEYLLQEVNKCCEQNLTLLTAYEDQYNREKEEHDNFYRELRNDLVTHQDAKPSHEILERLCHSAQSSSQNLNHEFQITSKKLCYNKDSFKAIVEDIRSWGKVSQIPHVLTIQPTCPVQESSPATTDFLSDSLKHYLLKSDVVRTYRACSPYCVTQLGNEDIATANANSYDISIFASQQKKRSFQLKVSQAVNFNQGITGMCMSPKGTLIISNPDQNEIQNVDLLGNLVNITRVPPKEEFDPAGMVCSPRGLLYVCDRKNHLVRVFDLKSWEEIARMGQRGKEPGNFNNPSDVALMPDGEIAVADFKNDRIQIFDGKTLVFKRMIATSGSELGQLRGPSGIAIDSDGFMAISEPLNHRVQLFTPGGKPFKTLGAGEEGPNHLSWPIGIAITMAKEVVVCDRENDKIQVY